MIDAACVSIGADARVDPAEVRYAESLATELLGADLPGARRLVRESLSRLSVEGAEAVRASVARRLRGTAEREVAYLAASGVIYRDGHLAHREADALASLARALGLDRETVDRLSTNERLVLHATYPQSWRLEPRSPAGEINDALEAWADERGLLRADVARAALAALDLESFQRLTFPRCAEPAALLWAAKYTLWLYLFDDVVERFTAAGELAKARAFVQPCLAVPGLGRAPPGCHALVDTFAELTAELYERAGDASLAQKWEDSHRRYWLLGILGEIGPAQDADDGIADLRHNLRTRPWASGVAIYFDIGEVICDAPIPAGLREAPQVEEIRYLGALIGGAFNDILSYDKEKPFDNLANTALALRRGFGLDDRGALTYSVAFHNDLVRACDRRIDGFSPEAPDSFRDYATMMRQALHGLAAWQLLSPRYLNRHSVEISTGEGDNPRIDPERLEILQRLALERN